MMIITKIIKKAVATTKIVIEGSGGEDSIQNIEANIAVYKFLHNASKTTLRCLIDPFCTHMVGSKYF